MINTLKKLVIISLVIINTGCGTLLSESHVFATSPPYPGVKVDYAAIKDGFVLAVFDLPFSFVADTIKLPWHIQEIIEENKRKEKANNKS